MIDIRHRRYKFNTHNPLQQYLENLMKKLYPLEETSKTTAKFIKNQVIKIIAAVFIGIIVIMLGVSGNSDNEIRKDNSIKRPDFNEDNKEIRIHVKPKDNSFTEEAIDLSITPRKFTYEEFRTELKKGEKYINNTFLKDNSSSDMVEKDLFFPSKVENSFLKIQWETDKGHIVDEMGKVHNSKLKRNELVMITAIFQYKKFEAAYSFNVSVLPPKFSKKEKFINQLKQKIEDEDRKNNTKICLPKVVNGKKITYSENKNNKKLVFAAPFFMILCIIEAIKKDIQKNLNKREKQLKLYYPEIMNQIALLLSAGLTIRGVFGKLTTQYQEKLKYEKTKRNYGCEEITVTYYEIENGMPEAEALERLGERIQLISYRKLMTLLIQNGRKGTKDLVNLLEMETFEAYEERKELVKTLGEKAGTKLLFPMMIILIIILTIIIVPVFMTL